MSTADYRRAVFDGRQQQLDDAEAALMVGRRVVNASRETCVNGELFPRFVAVEIWSQSFAAFLL